MAGAEAPLLAARMTSAWGRSSLKARNYPQTIPEVIKAGKSLKFLWSYQVKTRFCRFCCLDRMWSAWPD